jgi:ketosteroid isomerase-like protein
MNTTERTREVANRWFTALTSGDIPAAKACLDDNVEWINYTVVPGYNDIMPWIGTYHGPAAVIASLNEFLGLCEVQHEQLVKLVVDGEEAAGVIHEISLVRKTKRTFEIEFVQWLTVRDGKIVRWKSYTDPSSIIRAFRGNNVAS